MAGLIFDLTAAESLSIIASSGQPVKCPPFHVDGYSQASLQSACVLLARWLGTTR